MKNIILAIVLAVTALPLYASNVTGVVGASTDYLYRGESLSTDEPTVFGHLRFEDVVLDGIYFDVDGVLTDTSPYNETKTLRSEVGAGYSFELGPVALTAGAYRVLNPVLYSNDYNELRADANWALTDHVALVGSVAQIVSSNNPEDLYASAGVVTTWDKLSVSALASVKNVDTLDSTLFNNVELTASYNVWNNVDIFATYSFGGDRFENYVDGVASFETTKLASTGLVGVRLNFE